MGPALQHFGREVGTGYTGLAGHAAENLFVRGNRLRTVAVERPAEGMGRKLLDDPVPHIAGLEKLAALVDTKLTWIRDPSRRFESPKPSHSGATQKFGPTPGMHQVGKIHRQKILFSGNLADLIGAEELFLELQIVDKVRDRIRHLENQREREIIEYMQVSRARIDCPMQNGWTSPCASRTARCQKSPAQA